VKAAADKLYDQLNAAGIDTLRTTAPTPARA